MTRSQLLQKNRQAIVSIAERYGAKNVRAFGSVVRGEDHEGSDIDLLVHLEEGRTYFDYLHLKQALEEMLHCTVDMVLDTAVKPALKKSILDSAKPI